MNKQIMKISHVGLDIPDKNRTTIKADNQSPYLREINSSIGKKLLYGNIAKDYIERGIAVASYIPGANVAASIAGGTIDYIQARKADKENDSYASVYNKSTLGTGIINTIGAGNYLRRFGRMGKIIDTMLDFVGGIGTKSDIVNGEDVLRDYVFTRDNIMPLKDSSKKLQLAPSKYNSTTLPKDFMKRK